MAAVDVLLPFAAALVSARLAASLVRRSDTRTEPAFRLWAASLGAFALASAAIAWGAAAGWDDRAFRAYYLFGALLTAPLLGAGSLVRAGVGRVTPLAIAYAGLAVGVAIAVPLTAPVSGHAIPEAQAHLAFVPARLLAVLANVVGTGAALAVAAMGLRRRPVGNGLVLAGVAVAAAGSALAGLGVVGTSAFALAAALLLYAGFVARK